jgi:hypothetical protein
MATAARWPEIQITVRLLPDCGRVGSGFAEKFDGWAARGIRVSEQGGSFLFGLTGSGRATCLHYGSVETFRNPLPRRSSHDMRRRHSPRRQSSAAHRHGCRNAPRAPQWYATAAAGFRFTQATRTRSARVRAMRPDGPIAAESWWPRAIPAIGRPATGAPMPAGIATCVASNAAGRAGFPCAPDPPPQHANA